MSLSRETARSVCAIALLAGCFESPRYGADLRAAERFARALQDGDTVQMAALSLPNAATKMAAAHRELPAEYVAFARPTLDISARVGGGIYGGARYASFFVASTVLHNCHGGVVIDVLNDERPLVVSVRPEPPMDVAASDPCRDFTRHSP